MGAMNDFRVKADGCPSENDSWDPTIAEERARVAEIWPLTFEHWKVIRFMRQFHREHGIGPTAYQIHRGTGFPLQQLFQLFAGEIREAHFIAGLVHSGGVRVNKGFKAGERRPEPRLEGNDKNRRQVWPVIHPQTGRMGSIWRWPQTRKVQWAVAILAAVVSASVFLDILEPNKENQNPGSVGMTRIDASSGKGLIEVPLVAVEKNKLVSFEYQRLDGPVPLLAYRTPSGKIVTAVGFSEPCNSRSFHIEGNDIVCNLCLTRWNLETLEGGKGDCPQYPPDRLMHTVHEGRLIIREMDVQYWKPRPFPRTEEHPTV